MEVSVLSWGVSLNHPFIDGFSMKQTIHLGVPPFMENPKGLKNPARHSCRMSKLSWPRCHMATGNEFPLITNGDIIRLINQWDNHMK